MRHKLALVLANAGLLAVTIVLLTGPLLIGQLLGSAQSGALGVSQVAPSNRQLSVYPNLNDFSQYATFNPSPVVEPLFYQTSITFTAFAGQQATYNGLLTVYNPSPASIKVAAEAGNLSGNTEGSKVWLTVAPQDHSAVTLLTQTAEVGAKEIKVADAAGFNQGSVVIGETVLIASKKNATTLQLTEPITAALAVGEKAYLGAAFYNKQLKPAIGKTQLVTIPAQSRALVTLTVANDSTGDKQQMVLPIAISAE